MSDKNNEPGKGTDGDDSENPKNVEKTRCEEKETHENKIEHNNRKELSAIKIEKGSLNKDTVLNIKSVEKVRSHPRKKWIIVNRQEQNPQQTPQLNSQDTPQQNPQSVPPQTPELTPQQSPHLVLQQNTQFNPQQTPQQNPQYVPPQTLQLTPQQSPLLGLQQNLQFNPQQTPQFNFQPNPQLNPPPISQPNPQFYPQLIFQPNPQLNSQQNPQLIGVQNTQSNAVLNPQHTPHFYSQQSPQLNAQQNSQYNPQENPQPNRIFGFAYGYYYRVPPPSEGNYQTPPLAYDPESRNNFVRVVFLLVLVMLIVTVTAVCCVRFNNCANKAVSKISMLNVFLFSIFLLLIVNYGFMCSPCTRVLPCNLFMLFLAVCAMSAIASKLTVRFHTDVVLYAVLATAGIVIVCVILANTKFDFTRLMLYVIVIMAAFAMIIMIVFFVRIISGAWMKPIMVAILALSTILEAVLLVIELQMVLGGRAIELSENDYALGAYMIYTSVVDIFLKMGLLMNMGS